MPQTLNELAAPAMQDMFNSPNDLMRGFWQEGGMPLEVFGTTTIIDSAGRTDRNANLRPANVNIDTGSANTGDMWHYSGM